MSGFSVVVILPKSLAQLRGLQLKNVARCKSKTGIREKGRDLT